MVHFDVEAQPGQPRPVTSLVQVPTKNHTGDQIQETGYSPQVEGGTHGHVQGEGKSGKGMSTLRVSGERIPNPRKGDTGPPSSDNRFPVPVDERGKGSPESGDFDNGANTLWTLYGKEAKKFDEARILSLKDDMDSILLFAGLFSATLTGFIVDAKQKLELTPAEKITEYYQKQNVAMLAQISHQISSAIPQVVIPSTPPPPYPDFHPSPSAVRVNVFWFMALMFSLSAALLAILVQQWVRRYMRVFQRYSNPLKTARLRQYLHEGSEGWYMLGLAEFVPTLFHTSLFLFFVGVGDNVLDINSIVGVTTTIPIGICTAFYLFTVVAPVKNLQSPYHHASSVLIWYAIRWIRGQVSKDPGSGGVPKSMSSELEEVQEQLAMKKNPARQARDNRAVSWLVNKLTDDADMEPFVMAMPGSFNTEWGKDMWKEVSEGIENPLPSTPRHSFDRSVHPSSSFDPNRLVRSRSTATNIEDGRLSDSGQSLPPSFIIDVSMRGLSKRVDDLLMTCDNRGHFASDELWRKRTRACAEAITELVFRGKADLRWFGNIIGALKGIGITERIYELSPEGLDHSFVSHWTCLSIMAIRQALCKPSVQDSAGNALIDIANFRGQESGVDDQTPDSKIDNQALEVAVIIDQDFKQVWECLRALCSSLFDGSELTTSRAMNKIHNHELQISELKRISDRARAMESLDVCIAEAWRKTNDATERLTCQLPGVQFDTPLRELESPTFHETLHFLTAPVELLSVFPRRQLQGLCSIGPRLRDIMQGKNVEEHQETLNNLKMLAKVGDWSNREHMMETQLARLQDLRDGDGLGLAVELFFITLEKVLPKSPLDESQYDLYLDTFKRITSDWEKCRDFHGTQKVILNVVRNLTMRLPEIDIALDSDFVCPSEFTDALLGLLRKIFKGKTGPHILTVVEALSTVRGVRWGVRRQFAEEVSEILTEREISRVPSPS